MQSFQQLFVVLFLATTLVASSTSFAQENGKAQLQECLLAQAREFQPLAQHRDDTYQEFATRSTSIRNILRWLEDDYETANAKRIREIVMLEIQLKTLKANANLTTPEATKNLAATVKTANALLGNIEDERFKAMKPFTHKLTALQQKYKGRETTLDPVMMKLFREKGASGPTARLTKSYGTFSYSSGISSATYKRKGEKESAAICDIYLVNDKVGKEKYGLFNDKYPITYQTDFQLEVIVGRSRVTIYSSDKAILGGGLDAALTSLVDIEKLAAMLKP